MVTHADGRQSVEEIRDDLGVGADQYSARLHAQGVYATQVDAQGGVDDGDGGGGPSLAQAYAGRPQTGTNAFAYAQRPAQQQQQRQALPQQQRQYQNPQHKATSLW